jgi:opacity protein-like surface antigen
MNFRRFVAILTLLCAMAPLSFAGNEMASSRLRNRGDLDMPTLEVAAETAYLWGSLANPNSYEVGAQFITARMRWGTIQSDSWMRGYQQVYFLAMAQPFFRGPENFYFGVSAGLRYNWVRRPGARLIPYISGGVGLGWIDSHADVFGAQGQDFTFNILSAAGVSYRVNDNLKVSVGGLYEHFSNAGQTSPNPSLNLFGPQVGVTYSF